jgi:hypothetical protein
VAAPAVIVLAVVFGAAAIILVYSLLAFWPPSIDGNATGVPATQTEFFGLTIVLERERSLLLLVAIAGATGAMGHVIRSFFRYVGERNLVWSWVPSYFLTPIIGTLMALITYVVLRAGLIGGGATLGNPFGFAAIGLLVGMFSAQAAEKLKQVFETLFAQPTPGTDALEPATAPPTIRDMNPFEGRTGDPVEIYGTGLESITEVVFAGNIGSPAAWDPAESVLRTSVPAGILTGALTVTNGALSTTSDDPFVLLDDLPPAGPTDEDGDGDASAGALASADVSFGDIDPGIGADLGLDAPIEIGDAAFEGAIAEVDAAEADGDDDGLG